MASAVDVSLPVSDWRFCVAPMMDWTDRHCRFFHRQLSKRARLYTEMVTSGALVHGSATRHLKFDPSEHPVALQLGGSELSELSRCAELGARFGYDEINLNCGCPSDRVQEGRFGACLMREPERVADLVIAMREASGLPVTVKSRIGVDDSDDETFLRAFVETVAAAGCSTFIIHARKAWLNGLSPKENREIPPLNYERVYRLKQEFPSSSIIINGGIKTLEDCQAHLAHVDGVMLGREAYENPYLLAAVDQQLFAEQSPAPSRDEVLKAYLPYVERELAKGTPLGVMVKHVLGLFRGRPGGRMFRRVLSEGAHLRSADAELLLDAWAEIEPTPVGFAA